MAATSRNPLNAESSRYTHAGAVNAALQLSKPGKDAQAQARAEAGAKVGDDLVRAARELLGLQVRLRGWIEHKQALNRQIYQKEHPSHHQHGPAAQRPQMEDLDRFLQSLPPAEQPIALPAPARPDLRLSSAEQQARVDAEIRLARSELLARWLAHEQAHPILAAFRDANGQPAGLEALAGAGADPVREVLRTAWPKLVANRQTRQAMRSGALSPWALPRVVAQAQAELGIEPARYRRASSPTRRATKRPGTPRPWPRSAWAWPCSRPCPRAAARWPWAPS